MSTRSTSVYTEGGDYGQLLGFVIFFAVLALGFAAIGPWMAQP